MSPLMPNDLLAIPDRWEIRHQIHILEPPEAVAAPLSGKAPIAAPRANLVLTQTVNELFEAGALAQACTALREQLMRQIPGAQTLSEESFTFDDAAVGQAFSIRFAADPTVMVLQRHVFRLDATVLSHFAATVEARAAHKLEALDGIVRSYHATGGEK